MAYPCNCYTAVKMSEVEFLVSTQVNLKISVLEGRKGILQK